MIQCLGEFNARNRFVLMKDRLLVFRIIKIKIYLLIDITYNLIYSKHYTFCLILKEHELWIIIRNIFAKYMSDIIFRRLEHLKQ